MHAESFVLPSADEMRFCVVFGARDFVMHLPQRFTRQGKVFTPINSIRQNDGTFSALNDGSFPR